MMDTKIELIGNYAFTKIVCPTIENINYILDNEDKKVTSCTFAVIMAMFTYYLFRDKNHKKAYSDLINEGISITLEDCNCNIEQEKNFSKKFNKFIINKFKNKYNNLIVENLDDIIQKYQEYVCINYNYEIDFFELFKTYATAEDFESRIEKIIENCFNNVQYELYRRIDNELYDLNQRGFDIS